MGRVVVLALLVASGCGRTDLVRYRAQVQAPDAGGPVLPTCTPGVVAASPEVATVLFLVDRSGSMDFDLMGNSGPPNGPPLQGPTRWTVLRESLGSVLPTFERRLAMGLAMFPVDDECGVSVGLDLAPALDNAQPFLSRLGRAPGGGTPTADAVALAAQQVESTGANAVVLITDGEPNCNARLNPRTCVCTRPTVNGLCLPAENCLDNARAVAAVREAREDKQVTTYVVGLGATTGQVANTLDSLAVAGGAPRETGPHRFYSALSQDELTDALRSISARVTRCAWSARVALAEQDRMEVLVGDGVVPRDAWRWIDEAEGSFVLLGEWCDRAEAGTEVSVRLTCG